MLRLFSNDSKLYILQIVNGYNRGILYIKILEI